jgi:hypothetical protein
MSTFIMRTCGCFALGTMLAVSILQQTAAAEKSVGPAQTMAAEEKIRAALRSTTTIEFIETPLQDVIDYLKDMHGIEIQLDNRALEDAATGTDAPVTANLKGISLRSALDLVLGKMELTYVIQSEVLLITTVELVNALVDVRPYDIADLVDKDGDAESLARVVQQLMPAKAAKPGKTEQAPAPASRPTKVNGLTPTVLTVAPYRSLLVIRANHPGHDTVEDLLAQLRRKLKK